METSDKELILRHLEGDAQAFSLLVDRYLPQIYNFTYRLTRSKEEAEDTSQETFIKAWKHIDRFDTTQSFKTWIYKIARNTAIDHLRKKKQIQFSDMENAEGENPVIERSADTLPLPDELYRIAEEKKMLDKLLHALPPLYQEVLILYYRDELNFREIAEVQEKPIDTVKSQHRRALTQLRWLIEGAALEKPS